MSTASHSSLAFTARQYLIASAVTGALFVAGFGGYLYYHANSPRQLAIKAQLAMEQHDTPHAVEYLKRALARNPGGDMGASLRKLLAEALIDGGRESDARPWLDEALAGNPTDPAALDLVAQSYIHPAQRKLDQALKPLSDASLADIYAAIDEGLAALDKLPPSPRNEIAAAQLHRLDFVLVDDQIKKAQAALEDAKLAQDDIAQELARKRLAALKDPAAHRQRALELLQNALQQEPDNLHAAEFLVQYQYQDHHFADALALYRQFQSRGLSSQELVINAANAIIADAQAQGDYRARYALAEKELEAYAAAHPHEPAPAHILIAIGQTLVEQDKIPEALDMAQRAAAADPASLDAKILQINCKIRQRKIADALALATPLTNSHGAVPQVWYLVGLANVDLGHLQEAQDAFRKVLALNPGYTPARRALLTTLVRAKDSAAASVIAAREIRDDRYFIPAWEVTAGDLQKHGQSDRAAALLTNLAADPNLPAESRPQLIQLLLNNNLPAAAQELLAKIPANDDSTLRLRSAVAAANGNLTQARDLLAQFLAKDPADIEARLDYVDLFLGSNLAPDARAQLDQAAAQSAKTPPTVLSLTRIARGYLALRLPDPALAAIKQALAAQPQNPVAQSLEQQATAMRAGASPTTQPNAESSALSAAARPAADALAKKDYPAALTLARQALAKDSTNLPLHHLAARALAALGQTDAAVEEIITAARTQPDDPASFAVFVELFPTADAALKGLGYGNSLQAVNPALGNWAMGKLAETSGDFKPAFHYYRAGIEEASKTSEPAAAKDLLFRSILALDARRNDPAAIHQDAAAFAADPLFAVGVRLLAADLLRVMDDDAGVADELTQLTTALAPAADPQIIIGIAQRWLAINHADRALALVEQKVNASPTPSPELLDFYAALVQPTHPDQALQIRQQLVARDSANPQYRIGLAQAQAAAGDLATAFRTLDEARTLGETGRHLAAAARLRLLISLGLLHQAAAELAATSAAPTADDFASMLAIGQAWMQLNNPAEARKFLAAIPLYALEFPAAAASLAALDSSAGKSDQAVARLQDARAKSPQNFANETTLAPALFQTYLRAANPAAALDLAKKQLALFPVNTPPARRWIIYAATAAREARDYAAAIAQIESLDAPARKASALDLAMLQLLQNKPFQSSLTAATLPNTAPTFDAATFQLLAGAPTTPPLDAQAAALLSSAVPSTVYAVLAALPPEQQKSHLSDLAKNPRVIPADIDHLLAELAPAKDRPVKLRQLALAGRLLEMGWSTSALDVLDTLDKSTPAPLTVSQIQRYEALTDLQRFDQTKIIRDQFAARIQHGDAVPPGVRIVLASDCARQEHYDQALAFLQPLESLNRPPLLTTLASFHEKIGGPGQIDQAIALHRRVRALEPANILAANNLAYTLTVADPADPAALAQAKTAIQYAIDQAPDVTAFQDTRAWIEVLSGKPQDGATRLARALPSLRLDPAVHYHLGIAYLKSNQPALARLFLENVQYLSQNRPIPELALATQALQSLASEK